MQDDRRIPVHTSYSYEQFLDNTCNRKEPFLLVSTSTSGWPVRQSWILADGSANLDALLKYGHHLVQVADTAKKEFNEFERSERPLSEVLELWRGGGGKTLYVKDWHQALQVEEEGGSAGEVYETPDIFQDDWMTNHALSLTPPSDYRFTYLGPAGTFTPLHRDVYGSYSWSANVVGRKRWWLIPPQLTKRFKKRPEVEGDGEMMFDLREMSEEEREGVLVVEQEAGETIFVPSGWYHQVENLTFCISINQNFCNSATIQNIYHNLLYSLDRVEISIEDIKELLKRRLGSEVYVGVGCVEAEEKGTEPILAWEREWVEEVQKVLEMDAGWGLSGFWGMVLYNLRHPPTLPALRPPDSYVSQQLEPLIIDFKARREYVVMPELAGTVLQIEHELHRMKCS